MTRLRNWTVVALVAGLAAPAAAQQQQQTQSKQNQDQQQRETLVEPQLSEQGRACVDRLEQVDRQLAEFGYGRPGPQGYGVYGTAYGPAPTTADGGSAALTRPLQATPRADMYALMRSGYVMARTGYDEGCQQVASAVEDISQRYRQAIDDGDVNRESMAQWRQTFLADAVPVDQLQQPLRADQIIGSDLRNMRDEDLGDIEDVVVGPDGSIRYVVVQSGGFLGIGEDEVPVPWSDLRVTAAPYSDTFVLDVSQQAFEDAPRLGDRSREQLATGGEGRIESFWDNQLDQGQQQQQQQQQ
jgi:hypothetical protein